MRIVGVYSSNVAAYIPKITVQKQTRKNSTTGKALVPYTSTVYRMSQYQQFKYDLSTPIQK